MGKVWVKGGTGNVSEEAIELINKKLSSLSLGPRERLSGSGKATSLRSGKRSLKLRDEVPNANAAVDCAVKKVWVLEPPENFVDSDLLDPKYDTPGALLQPAVFMRTIKYSTANLVYEQIPLFLIPAKWGHIIVKGSTPNIVDVDVFGNELVGRKVHLRTAAD
jgi:hypothetical protein